MFAWGAQNILARGFYATRDTLTPAVSGTIFTVLNLPVYWLLVHRMQHLGLALASSIGVMAYTVVLFVLLNRRTQNPESAGLTIFFLKLLAASSLAAAASYGIVVWLEPRLGWQTTGSAFLVLAVASAVGFLLTGILSKLLRVRELDSYLAKVGL